MTFNGFRNNCIFNSRSIALIAALWLAVLLTAAGCGGGSKSSSSGGKDDTEDPLVDCIADKSCGSTARPTTSPSPTVTSAPSSSPPLTLRGVAIGPWKNATVNLYAVDPGKMDISGSKLVAGKTNERAKVESVSLDSSTSNQLFVFEVLAKVDTTNLNTGVAPVVTSLQTLITKGSLEDSEKRRTNYSTLVTTMALRIAGRKLQAEGSDDNVISEVNDALDLIADKFGFGLLDDLNILDTAAVVSAESSELNSVVRYRTVLEAIAAILLDLQRLTGKSTDEWLTALADDLSDGQFDGQRFSIAIETFADFDIVTYLNGLEVANMQIANTSKSGNPANSDPYIISEVELLLANEVALLGNKDVDTSDLTNGLISWEPTALTVGADCDNDGIPDVQDDDRDNDGTPNKDDIFPCSNTEWFDTDGDGIGNNADNDDDNDGVPDIVDGCPLDKNDHENLDGDELCDYIDPDDDNDGVIDTEDFSPRNPDEQYDSDGDGIGNYTDPDDDNDGTDDGKDECPLDGRGIKDLDGDGICDGYDTDEDGDGYVNKEAGGEDGCDRDPNDHFDLDDDGVCDYIDGDIDGDGFANNNDAYERDPQRWYNCEELKDTVKPGDDLGNCEGIIVFPSPVPTPTPTPVPVITPVPNDPPQAKFEVTSVMDGDTDTTFTFDASSSTDDGDDLTFTWQFEKDAALKPYYGFRTAQMQYSMAGHKKITLWVEDDAGQRDSYSLTVNVALVDAVVGVQIKLPYQAADIYADQSDEPGRGKVYVSDPSGKKLRVLNADTGLEEGVVEFSCTPGIIRKVNEDQIAVALLDRKSDSECVGNRPNTTFNPGNAVAIITLDENGLDASVSKVLVGEQVAFSYFFDMLVVGNTLVISSSYVGKPIVAYDLTSTLFINKLTFLEGYGSQPNLYLDRHVDGQSILAGKTKIGFYDQELVVGDQIYYTKGIKGMGTEPADQSGKRYRAPFDLIPGKQGAPTQLITSSGAVFATDQDNILQYVDRMTGVSALTGTGNALNALSFDVVNNIIFTVEISDADTINAKYWLHYYKLDTIKPLIYKANIAPKSEFIFIRKPGNKDDSEVDQYYQLWVAKYVGDATVLRRFLNHCQTVEDRCASPLPIVADFEMSADFPDTSGTYLFDASETLDANQGYRIRWDIGSDGSFETDEYYRNPSISWQFPQAGAQSVTMEVLDAYGNTGLVTSEEFTVEPAN